jgi:hypothetical protein
MADYTTLKILLKNKEILEKDLGVTKEDIEGPIYSYMRYGPILESIVKKIAEDKGLSIVEVFNNFEKGQFESKIWVLKDVERSFGKGSLEVLSLLKTLGSYRDDRQLGRLIEKYFAEEDETKRQDVRSEIQEFVDGVRERKEEATKNKE